MKGKIKSDNPLHEWRVFDPEIRKYLFVFHGESRREIVWKWQKDYATASRFTEQQAAEIATVVNVFYGRFGWLHDRIDIINKSL
jgi:hypothetical protein